MSERTLLLSCRDLAFQLKTALVVLEGHSDLWQMADTIYSVLDYRAEFEKQLETPAEENPKR